MVDITMCDQKECPKFSDCYRAQAEPNKFRQSYFNGGLIIDEDGCEYFIKMLQTTPDELK